VKIEETRIGSVVVLDLNGRLDANTSGALEKTIKLLLEGGEKYFVMDFSRLDYISSAGLRILLMAAKKSNSSGGKVTLSCLKDHVREVFEIAGFTAIFPISSTREEAVQLFK